MHTLKPFKTYAGGDLHHAVVSLKIDGVRAHRVDGKMVSRAGKPLYNVPPLYPVCEVFLGTWEKTVSAVRTQSAVHIPDNALYCLSPTDPRLVVGSYPFLSEDMVVAAMSGAVAAGYEGLVIETPDYNWKVKPVHTYDVVVSSAIPGKGKHTGHMGALMTGMGKVGTGFTDEQRALLDWKGKTIEVECMGLTPAGLFRHPRFKRIREDK